MQGFQKQFLSDICQDDDDLNEMLESFNIKRKEQIGLLNQSPQRMQTKKDTSPVVGQVRQQPSAVMTLAPSDSGAKSAKENISKLVQTNPFQVSQTGSKREKSQANSASKERTNSSSQKHGIKNKSISPQTQKKTTVLMSALKQKLKNQNSQSNQNGMHYLSQKKQHNNSAIQYNNNNNSSINSQFIQQQTSIGNIIQQQCNSINKHNAMHASQFHSNQAYIQNNQRGSYNSGIESIENLLSTTSHANKMNTNPQDIKIPLKNSLSTSNMNPTSSESKKKKSSIQNSSISHIYGKQPQQQYQQQAQQQIQHLASIPSQTLNSSQRKQTTNRNLQLQSFGNNNSQVQGSSQQQLSQQHHQQQQQVQQSSTASSCSLNLNQVQGFSTNFKYEQLSKRVQSFWSRNMYTYQTDESNMKNYFDSLFLIFQEYGSQGDMKFIDILHKVLMNPIQKMIAELDKLNEERTNLLKDNEERRNEARQLIQQVETLQHKNDQYSDILKQIQDHQFHSPLLEKIFLENQKLNKQVVKQKHKMHEIRKKEDKVMRLLYFIRKEGIDVDKIYKQHMQTPRNETSSDESSFMMNDDDVFNDYQNNQQHREEETVEEEEENNHHQIYNHHNNHYQNQDTQQNEIHNQNNINNNNNNLKQQEIQQNQLTSKSIRNNQQIDHQINQDIQRNLFLNNNTNNNKDHQTDSKNSEYTLNFGNSSQKKEKFNSSEKKNNHEIIKIVEDHFIEQQNGQNYIIQQNLDGDLQDVSSIQPNNNINESSLIKLDYLSSSKKQLNTQHFKAQNQPDLSTKQLQINLNQKMQGAIFSNREYYEEDNQQKYEAQTGQFNQGQDEDEIYSENQQNYENQEGTQYQQKQGYFQEVNNIDDNEEEIEEQEDEGQYGEPSEEIDYNVNMAHINKNLLKQQQQYFVNKQGKQVPYFGNIPDLYLDQLENIDEEEDNNQINQQYIENQQNQQFYQAQQIQQIPNGSKNQNKIQQNSF